VQRRYLAPRKTTWVSGLKHFHFLCLGSVGSGEFFMGSMGVMGMMGT